MTHWISERIERALDRAGWYIIAGSVLYLAAQIVRAAA